MKKLYLSLFFNVVVVSCAILFVNLNSQFSSESANKRKIAILLPVSHPSLEKIKQGFIDSIKQANCGEFSFDVFNGNGNRSLMMMQAKQVISEKYDLIVPITTVTAQLVKEFSAKINKNVPVVYSGVSYPLHAGIIKSIENSGNNFTGVFDSVPNDKQIEYLLALKPDVKNILLVYHPDLEDQKNEIQQITNAKNLNLKLLKVFSPNEIFEKISSALHEVDVVFVLKDNTVVSAIDALIKLCNRNNITLLVSDLDSVEKGAAIGFGVSEYNIGVSTAKKAVEILQKGKKPSQIPSSLAEGFKLKINSKVAAQQGLVLDAKLFLLMQNSEII
ncbi:TPA: hypothetical protein DEO28_02290 [Candidatus Dependentiae bacterium]|nr:MAG: hypothetical protein UR14_C0008G0051 [candidate division TM6 bacterium GW2011_GWE2_31_21]KKP53223.1 MAG: hypothetical protein UR43_C0006G0006 [candidate division TM6 bacterium GW2011_GWF2_33_332]HBS48078.1 hypothetical protein [Candidatus Dependentiae bacterium]HBZ73319.1 hypothetical protein [Candidatus Dependentiae bacterium]